MYEQALSSWREQSESACATCLRLLRRKTTRNRGVTARMERKSDWTVEYAKTNMNDLKICLIAIYWLR